MATSIFFKNFTLDKDCSLVKAFLLKLKEDEEKKRIKYTWNKDYSVLKVDMKSLRESTEVQRQLEASNIINKIRDNLEEGLY